jgi:hypothetical protein
MNDECSHRLSAGQQNLRVKFITPTVLLGRCVACGANDLRWSRITEYEDLLRIAKRLARTQPYHFAIRPHAWRDRDE